MISSQYATNMARALMAAELIMAAVNCGGSIAARARALVEQAVPWTEHDPLDRRPS